VVVLDVVKESPFVLGIRRWSKLFVDVGLDEVVLSTEAGHLRSESVDRSVESGDVNWDDSLNVRKGSCHFSIFFEDNMVS